MKLRELVADLAYELETADGKAVGKGSEMEQALLDREIRDITNDSRKAGAGMLFFAIRGANSDGHDYAPQVATNGAAAILSERSLELASDGQDVSKLPAIVRVRSTRQGMALVSAAFFRRQSSGWWESREPRGRPRRRISSVPFWRGPAWIWA